MTFNQKRKRNIKAGRKYCYIAYTSEEIKTLYYDECNSLKEAMSKYEKNISKFCRQNGYYRQDYLAIMYNDVSRRITGLWIQEN